MISGLIATGVGALLLLGIRLWEKRSGEKHSTSKEESKDTKKPTDGAKEGAKGKGGKGKGKVSGYYQDGLSDEVVSVSDVASAIRWMLKNAPNLKSPLGKVADDSTWTKFVRAMTAVKGVPNRVGIFGFSPKRLSELGIALDKTAPPETQYQWFIKSMTDFVDPILTQHDDDFGQAGFNVDGKPITLSGLLALAHYGGIDGMTSWLTNDRDRSKFKATTAAFNAANGLF
jgi:hypothetical protein